MIYKSNFFYTKFFSRFKRPFSAVAASVAVAAVGMQQPVATAAATGGSSFQSPGGEHP